jgi:hypothetical protein
MESDEFVSKLKKHVQQEMSHYEELKDKQIFINHEEFNAGKALFVLMSVYN